MPISHKIRQYRAILGFALQGKVLLSAERGEEVAPKQRIWRGFMHQILVGSPHGGQGLVSSNKVAIHHWWFPLGSGCQVDIPTHPDRQHISLTKLAQIWSLCQHGPLHLLSLFIGQQSFFLSFPFFSSLSFLPYFFPSFIPSLFPTFLPSILLSFLCSRRPKLTIPGFKNYTETCENLKIKRFLLPIPLPKGKHYQQLLVYTSRSFSAYVS